MNEAQAKEQMTRRINAALVEAGWQQSGQTTAESTPMSTIVQACGQATIDSALMAAFNSLPPEDQANGTVGSIINWAVCNCTLDH